MRYRKIKISQQKFIALKFVVHVASFVVHVVSLVVGAKNFILVFNH
jgi:hypothetical protein